jgi:hypothetical protein
MAAHIPHVVLGMRCRRPCETCCWLAGPCGPLTSLWRGGGWRGRTSGSLRALGGQVPGAACRWLACAHALTSLSGGGCRMRAEQDEAQRRVDELTEEEVARLVANMMEGKVKPGRLRRVGATLYKRIASLEPALGSLAPGEGGGGRAAGLAGGPRTTGGAGPGAAPPSSEEPPLQRSLSAMAVLVGERPGRVWPHGAAAGGQGLGAALGVAANASLRHGRVVPLGGAAAAQPAAQPSGRDAAASASLRRAGTTEQLRTGPSAPREAADVESARQPHGPAAGGGSPPAHRSGTRAASLRPTSAPLGAARGRGSAASPAAGRGGGGAVVGGRALVPGSDEWRLAVAQMRAAAAPSASAAPSSARPVSAAPEAQLLGASADGLLSSLVGIRPAATAAEGAGEPGAAGWEGAVRPSPPVGAQRLAFSVGAGPAAQAPPAGPAGGPRALPSLPRAPSQKEPGPTPAEAAVRKRVACAGPCGATHVHVWAQGLRQ